MGRTGHKAKNPITWIALCAALTAWVPLASAAELRSELSYEEFAKTDPERAAWARIPWRESFWGRAETQAELDDVTGTELTRNKGLQLHSNGESLGPLRGLVARADKRIYVQVLAIACDPSTEPLLLDLESRARRGGDVRLIVNSLYAWLSKPCLERLEKSGIAVLRAPTHSTYALNDRQELIIGSQSFVSTFFDSTGTNGLDRDVMLEVHGPLATDALGDFLRTWDAHAGKQDRGIDEPLQAYRVARTEELAEGTRGGNIPAAPAPAEGLCRFLAEAPGGRANSLDRALSYLVGRSAHHILGSGVRFDDPALARELAARSNAGVRVDWLGNGPAGGNGEATMLLDRIIAERRARGEWLVPFVLGKIRDWDAARAVANRAREDKTLTTGSKIRAYAHLQFMHMKAWSFDRHGVLIGSANPAPDSLQGAHEAAALCLDESLARSFELETARDLLNSERSK